MFNKSRVSLCNYINYQKEMFTLNIKLNLPLIKQIKPILGCYHLLFKDNLLLKHVANLTMETISGIKC